MCSDRISQCILHTEMYDFLIYLGDKGDSTERRRRRRHTGKKTTNNGTPWHGNAKWTRQTNGTNDTTGINKGITSWHNIINKQQ